MTEFKAPAGVSRRRGVPELLIGLAFLGSPFLPVLTSPALPRLGVWYQSEPLLAGILGLAGLCALGLLVAGVAGDDSTRRALISACLHPVVMLPLMIAVLSAVLLPLVPEPVLSLYGPPQTGVGALWFLAIASLTAGFRFLLLRPATGPLRTPATVYLVIAGLAMAYIGVVGVGGWRPFYYTDYLAFSGLFIGLTGFALSSQRRRLKTAAVAVGAIMVLVSGNKAAFGALVAIPVVYGVFAWTPGLFRRYRRQMGAALPAVLLLVVTCGVFFARDTGLWTAISESIRNTFLSRALMLDVVLGAVADDPALLLTGAGWGMFSQVLLEQLANTQTSLFHYSLDTDNPLWRWDALWRFDFDSHNFWAESLLGGGLVAAILMPVWLACAVASSPGRHLAVAAAGMAGFAMMAAFWFQMPLSVPFMAMALAALSGPPIGRLRALARKRDFGRKTVPGILITVLLILGAALVDHANFMVHTSRIVDRNFAAPDQQSQVVGAGLVDDLNRGQYHFAEIMLNYVGQIEASLKSSAPLAAWQVVRLERFMAEADRRLLAGGPIHIAVRALNARSDLAFLPRHAELGSPFAARLDGWGQVLDHVLMNFPAREDLAVSYHLWLLSHGRERELLRRSERLLAGNGRSPLGLWFSGVVLLANPDRAEEGMARLKRALDNGIERLMPVEPGLKTSILEH